MKPWDRWCTLLFIERSIRAGWCILSLFKLIPHYTIFLICFLISNMLYFKKASLLAASSLALSCKLVFSIPTNPSGLTARNLPWALADRDSTPLPATGILTGTSAAPTTSDPASTSKYMIPILDEIRRHSYLYVAVLFYIPKAGSHGFNV